MVYPFKSIFRPLFEIIENGEGSEDSAEEDSGSGDSAEEDSGSGSGK